MVAWTLQEEEDDKALIFFVPIFLYLFQHVQLTAYGKRCVTIVPSYFKRFKPLYSLMQSSYCKNLLFISKLLKIINIF
ncbi:hypothetical protein BRADI_1g58545v3 [Brachypodium distachyon]|uniref:Uncharacterized protein n=1 Tax=Brachypodium distachyon TaxID=15368 RepID=A0A0Q3HDU8_BRADI|nr:hypothetical protein BRADI_1g58545v3 [Brachypodium distachyon]